VSTAPTAPRVRAVVLAAGSGSRFGGRKLEARIAGKLVLQHVLDVLGAAGHRDPIVIVAGDGPAGIDWGASERVTNPDPTRGLSSSLQLAWSRAMARVPAPDAVLVVLGDQPLLRADVVRRIVAEPLDPARPIIATRYTNTAARNPVRIEPEADELVAGGFGDMGLGPSLSDHPGLVRFIEAEGDNPDVDRPEDLVRIIEADWANRVRRNREQVDRLRETPDDADHYAPVAGMFRDDPRRTGDDILERLLAVARPDDTWLDVGAGAGRFAFPLALQVREVIAIDPSAAMAAALRDGAREHGIDNVRVIQGRWPATAAIFQPLPCADVSLIANVGHDTEDIGPFVDALDAAARRECIAVMQEQPPAAPAAPFFQAVHGEAREPLPALPDFLDLLAARGTPAQVELLDRPARAWRDRNEIETFLRRQTWVTPGSAGDARLLAAIDAALDSSGALPGTPTRIGIVRWTPRAAPNADRP
jgi:CTP:molybdopterin cytidylyltransferase MocA/SAM-dependent methyltransferase